MIKQNTNKLFYNKYPYKIVVGIKGGYLIRIYRPSVLLHQLQNVHVFNFSNRYSVIDLANLAKFAKIIEPLLQARDIKIRTEPGRISIFSESKSMHESMQVSLQEFITEIWEPEHDDHLEVMRNDKKIVLCDQLPKGKYGYKIIFKEMPVTVRQCLHNLSKNYTADLIYVSKGTKAYFVNQYRMQQPFMYVKDSRMILLFGLAAQGYVKRTEEFKLRSSINSSS